MAPLKTLSQCQAPGKFCRWRRDTGTCILTETLEEHPCLCTCLIPCALVTCQRDTADLWASKWISLHLCFTQGLNEQPQVRLLLNTCAALCWFVLVQLVNVLSPKPFNSNYPASSSQEPLLLFYYNIMNCYDWYMLLQNNLFHQNAWLSLEGRAEIDFFAFRLVYL